MLEFDGQAIDPAIVSAQPMKPTQNIDLPQMVCPLGRFAEHPCCLCDHLNGPFLANDGAVLKSPQFTQSRGYHNPALSQFNQSPHK